MKASDAISYIESTHKFGTRLGLESMKRLLAAMGNPQDQLNFIHIAGTNGKGSTATMVATILKTAGYKTGLFTSPFLESFHERIQIDNEPIDNAGLVLATTFVKKHVDRLVKEGHPHPTEFELVTALGLRYFSQEKVACVVLEVGMGGRLDATNIITNPLAVVIMGIGLDHTDYLGSTLGEIAFEKAAIIKEGRPVIIYPQKAEALKVIVDYALVKNAPITLVNPLDITILDQNLHFQTLKYQGDHLALDTFKLKLLGLHQSLNCLTALEVVHVLNQEGYLISPDQITTALAETVFAGRFEIFSEAPVILIDGAHNRDGIATFVANLKLYFKDRPITLYLGMLADKDIESALTYLVPIAKTIYPLSPNSDRAMTASKMAQLIEDRYGKTLTYYDSVNEAVASIDLLATEDLHVFVGSLYMVGEARGHIRKRLGLK